MRLLSHCNFSKLFVYIAVDKALLRFFSKKCKSIRLVLLQNVLSSFSKPCNWYARLSILPLGFTRKAADFPLNSRHFVIVLLIFYTAEEDFCDTDNLD